MTKRFPKFEAHEEASCFNCGGDFGDGYWSRSGGAAGDGEYVQTCEKCRLSTWYDLETVSYETVLAQSIACGQ